MQTDWIILSFALAKDNWYGKVDFHSPISGARATFCDRHFANTWLISKYPLATPMPIKSFQMQSFAA